MNPSKERISVQAELMAALIGYAEAHREVGRRFARNQELHITDSEALVQILLAEDRGQPLTPARLAERIALTTGATSTLLKRLEVAGHITRSHDSADRRIVTLRSAPAIHQQAELFHRPLATGNEAALADFTADELTIAARVIDRLRRVAEVHTNETA